MHMISNKRLRSLMCEPPCTTYSIAAHPAIRSHKMPEGFDPKDKRTRDANHLTYMSILLMTFCLVMGVPCLLENPRRSKMFWLRRMRAFLSRPGAVSVWLASCAYGSEFLKEFRFVGCWIRADALHRKCVCPRGWRHTPVQGQNAKRSAMYCRGLAQALARQFRDAVLDRTSSSEKQSCGLESLSANDVLLSAPWKVGRSWRWGQKRHINVLEAEATVSVLRDAALSGGDKRFCIATDSAVANRQGSLG